MRIQLSTILALAALAGACGTDPSQAPEAHTAETADEILSYIHHGEQFHVFGWSDRYTHEFDAPSAGLYRVELGLERQFGIATFDWYIERPLYRRTRHSRGQLIQVGWTPIISSNERVASTLSWYDRKLLFFWALPEHLEHGRLRLRLAKFSNQTHTCHNDPIEQANGRCPPYVSPTVTGRVYVEHQPAMPLAFDGAVDIKMKDPHFYWRDKSPVAVIKTPAYHRTNTLGAKAYRLDFAFDPTPNPIGAIESAYPSAPGFWRLERGTSMEIELVRRDADGSHRAVTHDPTYCAGAPLLYNAGGSSHRPYLECKKAFQLVNSAWPKEVNTGVSYTSVNLPRDGEYFAIVSTLGVSFDTLSRHGIVAHPRRSFSGIENVRASARLIGGPTEEAYVAELVSVEVKHQSEYDDDSRDDGAGEFKIVVSGGFGDQPTTEAQSLQSPFASARQMMEACEDRDNPACMLPDYGTYEMYPAHGPLVSHHLQQLERIPTSEINGEDRHFAFPRLPMGWWTASLAHQFDDLSLAVSVIEDDARTFLQREGGVLGVVGNLIQLVVGVVRAVYGDTGGLSDVADAFVDMVTFRWEFDAVDDIVGHALFTTKQDWGFGVNEFVRSRLFSADGPADPTLTINQLFTPCETLTGAEDLACRQAFPGGMAAYGTGLTTAGEASENWVKSTIRMRVAQTYWAKSRVDLISYTTNDERVHTVGHNLSPASALPLDGALELQATPFTSFNRKVRHGGVVLGTVSKTLYYDDFLAARNGTYRPADDPGAQYSKVGDYYVADVDVEQLGPNLQSARIRAYLYVVE